MKCKFWQLAVTLSSLYAATLADHLEELLAAENACMAKYPSITTQVLDEFKASRDFPKFQVSHPDINCFILCIGLEMKLVDEKGVLHIENLKEFTVAISNKMMTHDDAHAAINECDAVAVHDDLCERAGQYTVCKMEQLKEYELNLSKN